MNRLYHHCDFCGNRLEQLEDEVPISILALPCGDILFFCCEDCLWDFVKDHTEDAYINSNGVVERR